MEDAWINSAIFTAIYLKNSENAKIGEPGNLTPDELGVVMEFLIKHKKDGQFRTFWSGWEQGVQLVANQEVYVMTGWEPIVYAARQRGINAYYAVPKEGYEGWGNNTCFSRARLIAAFRRLPIPSPTRCSPAITAANSASCAATSCPPTTTSPTPRRIRTLSTPRK